MEFKAQKKLKLCLIQNKIYEIQIKTMISFKKVILTNFLMLDI